MVNKRYYKQGNVLHIDRIATQMAINENFEFDSLQKYRIEMENRALRALIVPDAYLKLVK